MVKMKRGGAEPFKRLWRVWRYWSSNPPFFKNASIWHLIIFQFHYSTENINCFVVLQLQCGATQELFLIVSLTTCWDRRKDGHESFVETSTDRHLLAYVRDKHQHRSPLSSPPEVCLLVIRHHKYFVNILTICLESGLQTRTCYL